MSEITSSNILSLKIRHTDGPIIPRLSSRSYCPSVSRGDSEIRFFRVVGRNKVPIAVLDDIQFECQDSNAGTEVRGGVTKEVHRDRGYWKGRAVVVKFVRRSFFGKDYDQALIDPNNLFGSTETFQSFSRFTLAQRLKIQIILCVAVVYPGLVVGLANKQYLDLKLFFDRGCNPHRPGRITALHGHDIVHADLKPENIPLF
jgi:serine/threonine protein kinase